MNENALEQTNFVQNAELRKAIVTVDGLDREYPCYLESGHWNGFACPWFEEGMADCICHDMNSDLTSHIKLDKDEESDDDGCRKLVYTSYDYCGEMTESFESRWFDMDGERKLLVPLGNFSWTWQEEK